MAQHARFILEQQKLTLSYDSITPGRRQLDQPQRPAQGMHRGLVVAGAAGPQPSEHEQKVSSSKGWAAIPRDLACTEQVVSALGSLVYVPYVCMIHVQQSLRHLATCAGGHRPYSVNE
jgi:hypothetical protein